VSTLPTPANSDDRINDNPDYRDGYVSGYVDALEAARAIVKSEAVHAVADLAARRDTLTAADLEGIRAALAGSATGRVVRDDCPEWCTTDHGDDDVRDDLVLHQGDDHTDGVVRKLLDAHQLDLRVSRTDNLTDGTVGTPALYVRVEAELTTWEQAAELARAILDGFGYVGNVEA
jgi:hypothetical protein